MFQEQNRSNHLVVVLPSSIPSAHLSKTLKYILKTRWEFHQHFTSSFFIQKSFKQPFCTYGLGLYFFSEKEFGAKADCKMLVKLTPGLTSSGRARAGRFGNVSGLP